MLSDARKIRFEIFGRDLMVFLLEILGLLDSKLLAMLMHKTTDPNSVNKDRFFCEIVNHVRKGDRLALLLALKAKLHFISFQGNINAS
jgi:hypothetical protein